MAAAFGPPARRSCPPQAPLHGGRAGTVEAWRTPPSTTWADHAAGRLAAAGFRRGGARSAVIELLDGQACALTARTSRPSCAPAAAPWGARASTACWTSSSASALVTRVEVGQGVARYEPARPGGDHHHHMVCDACGDVFPFADDELERTIDRLAGRVAFDVAEHDIVLHGACAGCRDQPAARSARQASASP